MKSFFLSLAILAVTLSTVAHAASIELLSHKNTSGSITKLSEQAVVSAWNAASPACLKDGSRLMGVNKAFKAKGLKYSDCSTSDNAVEKQRMLGYSVRVIRFTELPASMARELTKAN